MSINDIATSPFNDLMGFEIADWEEDRITVALALRNEHMNRSQTLHGGVVMTLIDAAGGLAGCYCPAPGHVRRALSLSVTTNFTGQTRGGKIRAIACKTAGGRKIFFATIEVFDDNNQLIAFGNGTYRYRSGSEELTGVPAESE